MYLTHEAFESPGYNQFSRIANQLTVVFDQWANPLGWLIRLVI